MGGTISRTSLETWLQDHRHIELKSLPPIVFWGIWLARNSTIFQEKTTAPQVTATQSLSIFSHFPQNPTKSGPKSHTPEQIDLQNHGPTSMEPHKTTFAEVVSLYISLPPTLFTQNWDWDRVQTTMQKLLTLKLLLAFAKENDLRHIQIFGDSQIVVKWARKIQKCHNIFLLPILEDTYQLLNFFDSMTISHVYRNKNTVADALSKAGLQLALGQWDITEHKNGDTIFFTIGHL
jgi:hypothetical protein